MGLVKTMKLPISLCLLFCSFILVHGDTNTKHYIVYLGKHSDPSTAAVISANDVLLSAATGSIDKAKQVAVHHYCKSFRGFSAMLTPEQVRRLEENKEVISIFESKTYPVHTTHSWDFLGVDVPRSIPQETNPLQSDVIIGSIDTGVWPESESFNDIGLRLVPRRFKGACIVGDNFTLSNCNRKIIGARYYYQGFEAENGPLESISQVFFRSARDSDGHGSHTASTIAGSLVPNTSLLGMATGLARGGAAGARLAIYKACWFNLCNDADLLSAFDDAINDGVDIISISAGPNPPQPSFFQDSISIGSFHAFMKGILVSASAGNSGLASTATNIAPWILTVAASSIDRKFVTDVSLGNSKTLRGTSLNPTKLEGPYSIIPGSVAAAAAVSSTDASFCKNNTLNSTLVAGRIVVCTIEKVSDNRPKKAKVVKEAGGVGMLLIDPVAVDLGFEFVIPTALIGPSEASELQTYLTSTSNPVANISQTTTILNTQPAPEMAVFSSKGPSILTPDIIKPDITAPGMNILAAWSPVAVDATAGQSVEYNIISGTSMSCPHVTGAAAIVKARHRIWSPAALKSALMTTATTTDNTQRPILRYPNGSPTTSFDYGSGHLNPIAAINPGLVYDYDLSDIIEFLCSNGADSLQLQNLTGKATTCHNQTVATYDLNYPSIAVSNVTGNMSVYRTVKNCHDGRWGYNVSVESPTGVKVHVVPDRLKFQKAGEKKSFRVDLVPFQVSNGSFVFGSITWRDGIHMVRSPIALNVVSV